MFINEEVAGKAICKAMKQKGHKGGGESKARVEQRLQGAQILIA